MKRAQKAKKASASAKSHSDAVAEEGPRSPEKGSKLQLSTVPDEVIAEYRMAFSMFDKDGDGAIDIDELRAVLASLGQDDITDEKLQSMFDTMDEDGNGTIDFLEFLSMMTQKMEDVPTESELRDFLKPFDMDGLGSFNIEELKRVVCTVGDKISEGELTELLSNIDIDKSSNSVSIEDFVQLLHLGASS